MHTTNWKNAKFNTNPTTGMTESLAPGRAGALFDLLPFPESHIPRYERFQHVRDQYRRIAVNVGFQVGRAAKVSLMFSVFGNGPSRSFLVVLIGKFFD